MPTADLRLETVPSQYQSERLLSQEVFKLRVYPEPYSTNNPTLNPKPLQTMALYPKP